MNSVGATWNTRGMTSSEFDGWQTPDQLFYFLDREFRFTIDLCAADARAAKCDRFFSPEQDSLSARCAWRGNCWLNPPYGRAIGAWLEKAWNESREWSLKGFRSTIVCLVPARTDTSWWHDYCMKAREIRFLRGRLRFNNERRGRCPFPSAIVIFGTDHTTSHEGCPLVPVPSKFLAMK